MRTEYHDHYINYFRYSAILSEAMDSFRVKYEGKDTVLNHCSYCWRHESGQTITAADFKTHRTEWESLQQKNYNTLKICLEDGPETLKEASILLKASRDHITCTASTTDGYTPIFYGDFCWGKDPEHSTFAVSLDRDGYGLRSAYGPATSVWDDALLDREDGSLIRLDSTGRLRLDYSWEKGCYTFEAHDSVGIQVYLHYFEDRFQVPYRPVSKTNGYTAPPAGWMTWYAVKFDACEQAVLENTKLQKELLADYGADTVWVDWEWYHAGFRDDMTPGVSYFHPDESRYPNGLKHVAEEIEKNGFLPALWIAPTHEPLETDFIRENPDVVLADYMTWCGRYFLDITHPKFLNDYLPRAIRQVMQWGYKALKWDVLPLTMSFADRMHAFLSDPECSTYQAFRNTMQIARDILGPDFYMLSCSGANDRSVLSACDIFDAARIGGDIFDWEEFKIELVNCVLRLYPYHNTVIYCDPDNVVLRPEFNNLQQAQTRISIVSLLGLPTTFGDDLRKLPAERLNLLRRGLPTLDIHPMDMRELELNSDTLIVNLVVNRPFGRWNVADVINFADEPRTVTVDLAADLGLEAGEYLVHEYWSNTFCGTVSGQVTITVPAFGSAVLSVRRKTGTLQLVSTSRHITQGAADLVDVSYAEGVLSGISKVVKDDPYCITVYNPDNDTIMEKTIVPDETGTIQWRIEP